MNPRTGILMGMTAKPASHGAAFVVVHAVTFLLIAYLVTSGAPWKTQLPSAADMLGGDVDALKGGAARRAAARREFEGVPTGAEAMAAHHKLMIARMKRRLGSAPPPNAAESCWIS